MLEIAMGQRKYSDSHLYSPAQHALPEHHGETYGLIESSGFPGINGVKLFSKLGKL